MTTPLLFANDSSIDEVSAEAYEIETQAMIDAMDDIAEEEGFIDPEKVVVLDL